MGALSTTKRNTTDNQTVNYAPLAAILFSIFVSAGHRMGLSDTSRHMVGEGKKRSESKRKVGHISAEVEVIVQGAPGSAYF